MTLYPIDPAYEEMFIMGKRAQAQLWTVEEVDLVHDRKDFNMLKPRERIFLRMVLAFFAASDTIVNENVVMNLYADSPPEVQYFYGFQIAMENVHSEMYSVLIDTYIPHEDDKRALFNATSSMPVVAAKASWAIKHCNSDASRLVKTVAFAIVEGVFFSASFCCIFWLKKRGLMPGLCFANELISRDEGMHCDFACLLYKASEQKLSEADVHEMVREAVQVENDFVNDALPSGLLGMNASMMNEYVEFCADRLLRCLGHTPIYNASMPFDWMEMISLGGKTNFFEKRVGEYSKAGVKVDGQRPESRVFTTDEEF